MVAQKVWFPSPSLLVFGTSHDDFTRGKSQEHLAILFCLYPHRHCSSQPVIMPSSLSTETELMAKQFRLFWSMNKLYVSHGAYSYLSEVATCHWNMTYFSYFKIKFVYRIIYLLQWITSEEHKDGHVSPGKSFPCQAYPWALLLPGNSLIRTVSVFVTYPLADAGQVFLML